MALQLLGNVNYHHSTARRQALLLQLNPKLKKLASDADFKDSALYLFGENFGTLAKKHLEAAEAVKKETSSDKGNHQGFQRSHPQKNSGWRGGSQFSGHAGGSRGWQASGNKARKGQQRKWLDSTQIVVACTQIQQNSLKVALPIHVINTQTLHIQALINTMNLSISCQRLAGE